jgi:hypothetical protein
MEAPQNRGFSILKYRVPPLWPTYVDERRTKFAKSYEIKVRCYWELFGEHVRNWRTLCFEHTSDNEDKIMGGLFLTIFIRCSYETSNFVERERRPNQGLEFSTKAQNPGSPKSFKFLKS